MSLKFILTLNRVTPLLVNPNRESNFAGSRCHDKATSARLRGGLRFRHRLSTSVENQIALGFTRKLLMQSHQKNATLAQPLLHLYDIVPVSWCCMMGEIVYFP